jgi:hypothetical protein
MADCNLVISVPLHDGARKYAPQCLSSIACLNMPDGVRPQINVLFNNYSTDFFCEIVEMLSDFPFPYRVSRQVTKPEGWAELNISETMANIIYARHELQQQAHDSDSVLWVDADMVLEEDTIERLMAHDCKLVGALCLNRHSELLLTNAWYDGDRTERNGVTKIRAARYVDDGWGLIEVDGIGLACVLVRKPLTRIQFRYSMLVDDAGFCNQARALGYKVWVDRSVKPVHLGAVAEQYRERTGHYERREQHVRSSTEAYQ